MAKKTNCAFCGKEITKGFFKGNDKMLDCGSVLLTCCEDCYAKYESLENARKKRFGTKLDNLKNARKVKKLAEADVARMYEQYVKEEQMQKAKYNPENYSERAGIFKFDANGNFSVRECATGFVNEDVTPKAMIKSFEKSEKTGCTFFDKNDITCIQYAKVRNGTFTSIFSKAYSFMIRFNDEKEMTYKPCITKTVAVGHGFGIGYLKSAEANLVNQLEVFKLFTGSDLPIVKVKKI